MVVVVVVAVGGHGRRQGAQGVVVRGDIVGVGHLVAVQVEAVGVAAAAGDGEGVAVGMPRVDRVLTGTVGVAAAAETAKLSLWVCRVLTTY